MSPLAVLELINHGLVLLFGLLLSADIAGGWKNRQQKHIIFALAPIFLAVQALLVLLWDVRTVERLYPLIVHLPLLLVLVLALKKPAGVALVSVCTAYLTCQLPRWVSLAVLALADSPLAGEICYTLSIFPIFFLLRRFFVRTVFEAIAYSRQSLLLFGSLPFAYYLYDYATSIYFDVFSESIHALNEFLPTALILFYVLFLTAYHAQEQKRAQAELQRSMLESELKQSDTEMELLRRAEAQAAIYQHDIRHHMTLLEGLLSSGKTRQAEAYIKEIQANLEKITPHRFCENETVNLLCSSFSGKAERLGIHLTVNAKLPNTLSVSDTELCSLLSNGLENALHAVKELEESQKWVKLYCGIRLNKLLIEVQNPCAGDIIMEDGLPVSHEDGHGYGCRSIRSIAQQNGGLSAFEAEDGLFTLRVMLPLTSAEPQQALR